MSSLLLHTSDYYTSTENLFISQTYFVAATSVASSTANVSASYVSSADFATYTAPD